MQLEKKIRIAVLGCGGRGMFAYAPYLKDFDNVEIVAAAEPIEERLTRFAQDYHLSPDQCYRTAEEFYEKPRMADVVFICTQDQQHYDHAMSALQLGYDILLEKPVSNRSEYCIAIANEAKRLGRVVLVCHVLRYTPFYQKIKELITGGRIGQVISLHQFENVGYWHFAHSFVRGLWNNSDETSPMILAKCCHDLDIILWLMGQDCRRVSSFGSLMTFMEQNAPEGCTGRCIDGCAIQDSCPYDALKIYLTGKQGLEQLHGGWPVTAVVLEPDREKLMEALRSGPYGRCVYHCNNNVVDHQVVNMEFMDGVTASLTMCGFTAEVTREIKIMGTLGEINGDMDRNVITVKRFGEEEDVIDVTKLTTDLSGHGGGENRLLRDLFHMVEGVGSANTALTSIDKSVQSHIMAFAAERSRLENGRPVDLDEIYRECNAPNTLAI